MLMRTYVHVHTLAFIFNSISNLYKLHRHVVFIIIIHCIFACYFELCTLLIGGNKELLLLLLLLFNTEDKSTQVFPALLTEV